MKFPGTCMVCNEKIAVNEVGLWAKGIGVKHEKCAQVKELECIVCGRPAGCRQCEFQDVCDIESVSPLCVCKGCSDRKNTFVNYQNSAKKKFPMLDAK